MSRVQHTAAVLTAGLFMIGISIPITGMLLGWSTGVDPQEKRSPAPFPERPQSIGGIRAFTGGINHWFNDRFAFRFELIRANALLSYYRLNTSPNRRVILGKNGWLFNNAILEDPLLDSVSDYRGTRPLTSSQLEWWRWMVADFREWCDAREKRFLLVTVPPRMDFNKENLPDYFTRVGPASAFEQFKEHMHRHAGGSFLELEDTLREVKQENITHFKTDTHWNWVASFAGYRSIVGRLGEWFPDMVPLQIEDFHRVDVPWTKGDLASVISLGGILGETITEYRPKRPRKHTFHREREIALTDATSTVEDPSLPQAIIYRDSFTEFLHPFLSEHFRFAYYSWIRKGLERHPLHQVDADLVMIIVADRSIRRVWPYPTMVQFEAAAERFDRDGEPFIAIPTDGPSAHLSEAYGWTLSDRGAAEMNGNAVVVLDALADDQSQELPMLRVEAEAEAGATVRVEWTDGDELFPRYTTGKLPPGRQAITLPVIDPAARGPFTIRMQSRGTLALSRMEIRTVPR